MRKNKKKSSVQTQMEALKKIGGKGFLRRNITGIGSGPLRVPEVTGDTEVYKP